jgi:hypothetical protein
MNKRVHEEYHAAYYKANKEKIDARKIFGMKQRKSKKKHKFIGQEQKEARFMRRYQGDKLIF